MEVAGTLSVSCPLGIWGGWPHWPRCPFTLQRTPRPLPRPLPTLRVSFLVTLAVGDTHSLSDPLHGRQSACKRARCGEKGHGCGAWGCRGLRAAAPCTSTSKEPKAGTLKSRSWVG